MTPAGGNPASRARSTDASVWPTRRNTPPGTARSGAHVTRAAKIRRRGVGIGQQLDGARTVVCADARGHAEALMLRPPRR